MNFKRRRRARLIGCTALVSTIGITAAGYSTLALADSATPATDSANQVQEVVVTAQRREQNVQDVPVAVTALTQAVITTNRVVTVNDLNLLAPGLTVEPAAGGTQIPSFTMRGITSYGVVPGSDKAISLYVDGVYISSARGSIFDLPDISQIEVLRGPQGTLFGRNATGGAVTITTRDPTGHFSVQQDLTGGNYQQFRSRTTIDTPTWGPFSAYISFVHNERRGDVQNLGGGTVWNYSGATSSAVPRTMTSPKWLGSENENDVFVAVKFQPKDWFTTVYKFDYSDDHSTPEAVAFLGADLSGPAGPTLGALLATNPVLTDSSGLRPSQVNNAFSTPRYQITQGQSLTSTIQGQNYTIKNIAAYRESFLLASDALDGLGGLNLPTGAPPPFPATVPFTVLGITNMERSKQWSDELQFIYHSKLLTLTVGGLLFQTKDQNGAIPGFANNVTFAVTEPDFTPGAPPGFVVPAGKSLFFTKEQSAAAYSQLEFHVMSNVDIVGGIRVTKDWKSGLGVLPPGPTPATTAPATFSYSAAAPTYLIGVNYKPTDDILLYGKYSTGFVSGGNVSGIPFAAETVLSWEAGMKAEFFDHRLRTNIALYDATYKHLQDAEGGASFANPTLLAKYPWIPFLGTFIIDQGGEEVAKGVEFEGTLAAGHGLTFGSNVSYTDAANKNPNTDVFNPGANQLFPGSPAVPPIPTLQPKWTVGFWGDYETTFENGLKGSVRLDANWRSALPLANPELGVLLPVYASFISPAPTWIVNGRVALGGFKVHGVDAEVALWAKNLTDDRSLTYALLIPGLVGAGNFEDARTFGVDLHLKY